MDKNLKTSLWHVASLCDANAGEMEPGAAAALKALTGLLIEDTYLDDLARDVSANECAKVAPFDAGILYGFAVSQVKDKRRKGPALVAIGKQLREHLKPSRASQGGAPRGLEVDNEGGVSEAGESLASNANAAGGQTKSAESGGQTKADESGSEPAPPPLYASYLSEAQEVARLEAEEAMEAFIATQREISRKSAA